MEVYDFWELLTQAKQLNPDRISPFATAGLEANSIRVRVGEIKSIYTVPCGWGTDLVKLCTN